MKFTKFLVALALFTVSFFAIAEPLDINTATVEQLDQTLTNVGKIKAEAIVQDREKNGKFKSVDDLTRVKGIGPATIQKNRDKIMVTTEAKAPENVSPAKPK